MAIATVLSYSPSESRIVINEVISAAALTSVINITKGIQLYTIGKDSLGSFNVIDNNSVITLSTDTSLDDEDDIISVRYQGPPPWENVNYLRKDDPLLDDLANISIYDLAVEAGYTGTELDWINLSVTEFIRFDLTDEFTPVVPETAIYVLIIPYDCTFQNLKIYLNEAPVGASFLVDIKVDNVSVLESSLTIVSGELESVDAQLIDSELLADTRLQFDVVQVGVTSKGAGLKFSGEAIKKWL